MKKVSKSTISKKKSNNVHKSGAKLNGYRSEIKRMQLLDNANATALGFIEKKDWFNHICQQDYDYVAKALIELAKRYKLPYERVAHDFDSTMIVRLGRYIERQQQK